jgi:hypothetical protein
MALLLKGEFTLSSFLNILENWSRMCSVPYIHELNNDSHNFIVPHDIENLFTINKRNLPIHT